MLSPSEYLLTKLSEEAVEVAHVAFSSGISITDDSLNEFKSEVNDLLGVLTMLPHIGVPIYPSKNEISLNQNASLNCTFSAGFSLIGFSALKVAKLCNKFIIFGTETKKVGSTTHDLKTLKDELTDLLSLVSTLANKLNISDLCCPTQQDEKRQKIVKYLKFSHDNNAISYRDSLILLRINARLSKKR